MSFVIVGNNDGPLTLLRALSSTEQQPVAVGLQKPVAASLREAYLQHVHPDSLWEGFDEEQLLARLAPRQPRWLVNCFCNFKFKALLDQYACLNVHLAPLPRYRGRHPLHWALINGEPEFGVTIHQMTSEFDAGDIYWQALVSVDDGMSVRALRQRLMEKLEQNFARFWQTFLAEGISSTPNADQEATYVARRFPEDSQLTEWHDRDRIYRKVNALRSETTPAYLQMGEHQIRVLDAKRSRAFYVGLGAPFISRTLFDGIEVACGDGRTVRLLGFNPRTYGLVINQKLF